ncbi:hypothetical protein DH2020_018097 [Rehmannia glutinosa]|uniref:Solute carrier protein n=1 Tax=Rehmannia glutinosa TaxID=99300 RepID=A0ABR0WJ37_REHGL
MSSSWWRKNEGLSKIFLELGLGQLVSFDLAIMQFTSSLAATQVDAPLTLSLSTYLLLAVVYGSIMLYRRQKLLVPWYWYVLLAFVDVHGNYLGNVLSYSCLGLVLLSDAGVGGGGGSKPILGDFLVIAGSFFYAMSNVGEEFCVKKKDRIEVIAMIGLFGMLVTVAEIPVLERKTLESMNWSTGLISAYAGYAVSSFLFYTIVPFVLQISGTTLFNLSLLTSDMWAVAVRTFIYKQKVDWLYYLAFVLVVLGIFIYSKTEKDADSNSVLEEASHSPEYCLIDEENSSPGNEFLTSPRN